MLVTINDNYTQLPTTLIKSQNEVLAFARQQS